MNSCLTVASTSLSGHRVAGICSACSDALNLRCSQKVTTLTSCLRAHCLSRPLFFQPYFSTLEDKVRIQGCKDTGQTGRQAGGQEGRKEGRQAGFQRGV